MTFIKNIQQLNIINTQLTPQPTAFKGAEIELYKTANEPPKDSFTTNPLYRTFDNQVQIEAAARSNPRIMEILNRYKIPLRVNMEELEKLKTGHMKDVRVNVAKIYSSLPPELKLQVNPVDLQQAAMLHDYGKILIPDEILNKPGALTPEERQIVEQHSELGYELLKTQGIKPEVLTLIKYHHKTANGGGYPKSATSSGSDIGVQVLRAADIYSALTENRSYKNAMSRDDALAIMKKDAELGNMPEEVYQALCKMT